jgi:hypothetical protein
VGAGHRSGEQRELPGTREDTLASWREGLTPVALDRGQNPEDPNVAVDAAGEATAAWTRSTSSSSLTEAAVMPAGDSFEPAIALDEQAGGFIGSAVAVNEAGETQVLWSHRVSSESEQARPPTPRSALGSPLASVAASGALSAVAVDRGGVKPSQGASPSGPS